MLRSWRTSYCLYRKLLYRQWKFAQRGLTIPWACTVRMARKTLNLRSATLPTVSRHLGIKLDHHDPMSDATASALIAVNCLVRQPDLLPMGAAAQALTARARVGKAAR